MNKGKAATVLAVIVALLALAALAVLPQPERNPYRVHEVPAAVEGAAEDEHHQFGHVVGHVRAVHEGQQGSADKVGDDGDEHECARGRDEASAHDGEKLGALAFGPAQRHAGQQRAEDEQGEHVDRDRRHVDDREDAEVFVAEGRVDCEARSVGQVLVEERGDEQGQAFPQDPADAS